MNIRTLEDTNLVTALSYFQKSQSLNFKIVAKNSSLTGRVCFECAGEDLDFALSLIERDEMVPVRSFLDELRNVRRLLFATKGVRS